MKLSIITPVYNQEELVIKMLEHLPRRNDIEVIVRDDGSTDSTLANLLAYREEHPGLNLQVYSNGTNRGVAWTKNRLLESATGEYIHIHDSDDYVVTDAYDKLIDQLDGADIYTFDLIINTGEIFKVDREHERLYCAQIARFIRRAFAEGITFPEDIRAGDDWYYAEDLMKRNPVSVYTGVPAYMYNFPREGSLSYMQRMGLL